MQHSKAGNWDNMGQHLVQHLLHYIVAAVTYAAAPPSIEIPLF